MSESLKASQRQEARVAKRFGGRRTPGSGNTPFWKNDVRNSDTSFEMKWTGKKQYTLKASELEQGERHAILDGRDFVFGIEMGGRNWIVISEDDYASLAPGPFEVSTWVGEREDGVLTTLYVLEREDGTVLFSKEALEMVLTKAGFEARDGS